MGVKRRILAAAAVAGAAALLPWAVLHGRRDGPGWENIEGARYAHRGLHGPACRKIPWPPSAGRRRPDTARSWTST